MNDSIRTSSSTDSSSAPRGAWTSRWGFILAAAGSAVGLGNLWKFPYVAWTHRAEAFVPTYLLAVAIVGLPIMTAELLLGRRSAKGPVGALRELLGPAWTAVGALGVLTGAVILSYYAVVAGWSLRYFAICVGWSLRGFDAADASGDAFASFAAHAPSQILLTTLFLVLTVLVVRRGVGAGIENAARVAMPVLFAILMLLLFNALRMDGAGEALRSLFLPTDLQVTADGMLGALGQAFFSLSLGMGAMITYGSYIEKKESLVRSAALVVFLDTLIAIATAVVMFTLLFSIPTVQDQIGGSTAGMLFITLPNLFYQSIPLGSALAPLFYLLVAFAALTSTVSLFEVTVNYFVDQRKTPRTRAVFVCGLPIWIVSILCSLSFGGWNAMSDFGFIGEKRGLFDHLDHMMANWSLPTGALFITIGVGWFLDRRIAEEELLDEQTPRWFHFGVWRFFLRFVAPLAVAAILGAVFIAGVDFT